MHKLQQLFVLCAQQRVTKLEGHLLRRGHDGHYVLLDEAKVIEFSVGKGLRLCELDLASLEFVICALVQIFQLLDAVYQEVELFLLDFCHWIKLVVLALHLYLLRLLAQLLVRCAELLI